MRRTRSPVSGDLYRDGRGVNPGDVEAVAWYRKAAAQGIGDGQYELAEMIAAGRGVAQNDLEALRYYRLAAEQGFDAAMLEVARFYGAGRGTPKNLVCAYFWLGLAATDWDLAAEELGELEPSLAELTTLRATLQREVLDQESTTARVHSEYEQAKMERETNDRLAKNGLIAELDYKTSKVKEEELANRDNIEQKRLAFSRDSIEPQIASKQAAVDQAKQLAKLKADQVEALHVRAGMSGVLQQLPVQIGQRVKVGDNLARVADPTKLKAQVKIAETQAKDIQINQQAVIDTRNGTVNGHVTRVDPAVEQGTVTVDVAFDGTPCQKERGPI